MVLIRADANAEIGTGHVMRCLSLARAFAHRGTDICFVTADQQAEALLSQQGFPSVCLNSEWTDMERELPALRKVVEAYRPELLLIDSYYVTAKYLCALSGWTKTAYIDDMNQERWPVHALVNYNIFSVVWDYSQYKRSGTKLLLSPRYAPLREEFRDLPKHEIQSKVTDILISAGGADPEHISEKILEEICPQLPKTRFHLVVGALNPRLKILEELAANQQNVVLHINEHHMAALMQRCDMAVSAAGTTLYELCAAGIPAITYTLADNQLVAAKEFEAQGVMLNAGDCRENRRFMAELRERISRLAADVESRSTLSHKMQALVDGYGADRVAEELLRVQ